MSPGAPVPTVGGGPTASQYQATRRTMWIAGAFCLLVGGFLIANHLQVPVHDPLKAETLLAAKEQLRERPGDESLKQQVRALDLQLRQRFFRHLGLNRMGGWLLLGGAAVLLLAAQPVLRFHRTLPIPPPASEPRPDPTRSAAAGRWAVAAGGLLFVILCVGLAVRWQPRLPDATADLETRLAGSAGAAVRPSGPGLEAVLQNWHRFRGPWGDGVALYTNLPTAWNGTNGEGIAWKTAIPAPGPNSPVVWGNRVFLSGGTATTREVFCFDAVKGDLLWQRPVPLAPAGAEGAEVPEQTGHAAATVTTDGERVFALFATGELAALDFGGGMVWTKQLGAPRNPYGHSTSLVVWEGHLLVQFDQGEAEAGKSRLYSFEPATGRERWQQRRAVPSSWATPIVLEIAQRYQVVTLGEPWVISYDLAEGNEIWRAECMGTDVAPSPVFAAGLVFVASPHKHVVALRPDGQGDVSKTHLAWSSEENIPDITSPVCNGELLFTVTTYGILTCFDAKSGAKIWEHELDQEVNASPLLAGQRLYVMSTQGTTIQVAAERTYRELGRAELGEAVFASPAAVKDRLYVRSVKHLYGIGTASTPPAP